MIKDTVKKKSKEITFEMHFDLIAFRIILKNR